jgi:4-alpha-glucanotransferase
VRHTGILTPLFSMTSRESWGIGELTDVAPFTRWIAAAGADGLMLLPICTMADDPPSPYSAVSAMAIDPIYIGVEAVSDFAEAGGVAKLSTEAGAALSAARASSSVRHREVRRAKTEALDRAFDRFTSHDWARQSARAEAFDAYTRREAWWLDDYALFQALAESTRQDWRQWPEPLGHREAAALADARRRLSRDVQRHQYLQWLAEEQWQEARAAAESQGVRIFGDVPFVVNLHSADVWTRAGEFMLDVSLGVPPDAFSETGQDWGLPVYRWDAIAVTGYEWLRQRARRMAALFHGLRLDHLVGFYRTYGRPGNGSPFFTPADEPSQIAQGEALVRLFATAGAELIVEDLGTIPDFVRESLARLGVAGSKVLRWERRWHEPDQPFIEPADYPARSCALTSTHDTETLAEWWDNAPHAERDQLLRLRLLERRGLTDRQMPWNDALRDALLDLAASAGSEELFIAIQDVFGWRDRINVPATVGEHNWTWRLPWPVDALDEIDVAKERAQFLQSVLNQRRG